MIRTNRVIIRVALLAAIAVAFSVAVTALRRQGTADPATWATLAAVLAVLAAVTSAWTSQRVVELQEDALEPHLVTSIDTGRRYGLAQFRVTNKGGSSAHEVHLEWKHPLLKVDGSTVVIGNDGHVPVIAVGESASALIGASHEMFARLKDTTCSGRITFKNASGSSRSTDFLASAERQRHSLIYDEEDSRTHYELQKIPQVLKEISEELRNIGSRLDRGEDH
jgi:hypothetical protein